jgi:hypothetical protein
MDIGHRSIRPHTVTAKHTFEVELSLKGKFQPGYGQTGPTYDSGGEPGCGDSIEDMEIADIGICVLERRSTDHLAAKWATHSILTGVDRTCPTFLKILANIEAIEGADALDTLLGETE